VRVIEQLYLAAQHAGLLKQAHWSPASGAPGSTVQVAFQAPDESVLDGYQLSADYRIRYPASYLPGLQANDVLSIDGMAYRVRAVRAVSDGSEHEARLCRP